MGKILGVGAVATLAPLAGTWVAVGAWDAALVGASVVAGVVTAVAGVAKQRVSSLPLEVSRRAAVSWIDGERVVRARACLGRGRRCRPTVEVWWERDEARTPLTPLPLPTDVVGPLLVSAVLPEEADAGEVVVRWSTTEGGRAWSAEGRYPIDGLVDGHFRGGICRSAGRLHFDGDWATLGDAGESRNGTPPPAPKGHGEP